jgi:hypothetical protein
MSQKTLSESELLSIEQLAKQAYTNEQKRLAKIQEQEDLEREELRSSKINEVRLKFLQDFNKETLDYIESRGMWKYFESPCLEFEINDRQYALQRIHSGWEWRGSDLYKCPIRKDFVTQLLIKLGEAINQKGKTKAKS